MNDSIKELNQILGILKNNEDLTFQDEFKLYISFTKNVYLLFLKEKDPDEMRFKIGNMIVDMMKKGFDFEKFENLKRNFNSLNKKHSMVG